ncbi:hypothetical protein Slala02_26010 [Streptomyces lavendulae subsp. lavendulae]|nr:hypothetical protein Slala01_41640 [Streptomyces lavendulae subsp. lavendulae]GLX26781.1 hypothetical protein Slala02_26010 [Streptomyces lavendulae subsp. lavendulae]
MLAVLAVRPCCGWSRVRCVRCGAAEVREVRKRRFGTSGEVHVPNRVLED